MEVEKQKPLRNSQFVNAIGSAEQLCSEGNNSNELNQKMINFVEYADDYQDLNSRTQQEDDDFFQQDQNDADNVSVSQTHQSGNSQNDDCSILDDVSQDGDNDSKADQDEAQLNQNMTAFQNEINKELKQKKEGEKEIKQTSGYTECAAKIEQKSTQESTSYRESSESNQASNVPVKLPQTKPPLQIPLQKCSQIISTQEKPEQVKPQKKENITESKVEVESARRKPQIVEEPQVSPRKQRNLDMDMQAQLKRFLQQVEEIQTAKEGQYITDPTRQRNDSQSSKNSDEKEKDSFEEDDKKEEKFDPKDHKQFFEGWNLYKKQKISLLPVRKYIAHVDSDYKKNKVTVCANLSNIYNTFIVRNGRPGPTVNNFFDIDKWLAKFDKGNESSNAQGGERDLKRMNTMGNFFNDDKVNSVKQEILVNKEGQVNQRSILLPKSLSTQHIPQQARNKYSKRIYANFDKENALKMFGYRVVFTRNQMKIRLPDPKASQNHKPLTKYVREIVSDLQNQYVAIPKYWTRRKILIPILDSDEEEEQAKATEVSGNQKLAKDNKTQFSEDEDENDFKEGGNQYFNQTNKSKAITFRSTIVKKVKGQGDNEGIQYQKKIKNLNWVYENSQRQYSSCSSINGYNAQSAGRTKSPDRKNGSPQRSANSFSISPKKTGQNNKEKDPRELAKISRFGIVRFMNPKQGLNVNTQNQNNAQFKDNSPKKRGSNSRLSELRDSKNVNTIDQNNEYIDHLDQKNLLRESNHLDKEVEKITEPAKAQQEIVYASPLLNNSNIHLQTSQDGTSLTCTVDFETYQKLKTMDPKMQQAVLQEISQIHLRQQQQIKSQATVQQPQNNQASQQNSKYLQQSQIPSSYVNQNQQLINTQNLTALIKNTQNQNLSRLNNSQSKMMFMNGGFWNTSGSNKMNAQVPANGVGSVSQKANYQRQSRVKERQQSATSKRQQNTHMQFQAGNAPTLNLDALSFEQMMSFLNNQQINTELLQKQIANSPLLVSQAPSYHQVNNASSAQDSHFVGSKIKNNQQTSNFVSKKNSKAQLRPESGNSTKQRPHHFGSQNGQEDFFNKIAGKQDRIAQHTASIKTKNEQAERKDALPIFYNSKPSQILSNMPKPQSLVEPGAKNGEDQIYSSEVPNYRLPQQPIKESLSEIHQRKFVKNQDVINQQILMQQSINSQVNQLTHSNIESKKLVRQQKQRTGQTPPIRNSIDKQDSVIFDKNTPQSKDANSQQNKSAHSRQKQTLLQKTLNQHDKAHPKENASTAKDSTQRVASGRRIKAIKETESYAIVGPLICTQIQEQTLSQQVKLSHDLHSLFRMEFKTSQKLENLFKTNFKCQFNDLSLINQMPMISKTQQKIIMLIQGKTHSATLQIPYRSRIQYGIIKRSSSSCLEECRSKIDITKSASQLVSVIQTVRSPHLLTISCRTKLQYMHQMQQNKLIRQLLVFYLFFVNNQKLHLNNSNAAHQSEPFSKKSTQREKNPKAQQEQVKRKNFNNQESQAQTKQTSLEQNSRNLWEKNKIKPKTQDALKDNKIFNQKEMQSIAVHSITHSKPDNSVLNQQNTLNEDSSAPIDITKSTNLPLIQFGNRLSQGNQNVNSNQQRRIESALAHSALSALGNCSNIINSAGTTTKHQCQNKLVEQSLELINPDIGRKLMQNQNSYNPSQFGNSTQATSGIPNQKSLSQNPVLRGGEQILMNSTDFYKAMVPVSNNKNDKKSGYILGKRADFSLEADHTKLLFDSYKLLENKKSICNIETGMDNYFERTMPNAITSQLLTNKTLSETVGITQEAKQQQKQSLAQNVKNSYALPRH